MNIITKLNLITSGEGSEVADECRPLDMRLACRQQDNPVKVELYAIEDNDSNGGYLLVFADGIAGICFNADTIWGEINTAGIFVPNDCDDEFYQVN